MCIGREESSSATHCGGHCLNPPRSRGSLLPRRSWPTVVIVVKAAPVLTHAPEVTTSGLAIDLTDSRGKAVLRSRGVPSGVPAGEGPGPGPTVRIPTFSAPSATRRHSTVNFPATHLRTDDTTPNEPRPPRRPYSNERTRAPRPLRRLCYDIEPPRAATRDNGCWAPPSRGRPGTSLAPCDPEYTRHRDMS